MEMLKISAVIIARNEEQRIARAIESLHGVAEEIIVVDSFSTDRTAEVARQAGCRVEQRRFSGFGEQRQYATSLASHRYVLFIDADEALSPLLRDSILKVKINGAKHRVYSFSRLNFFCDSPVRRCGWYPDRQVRLFDKRYASWNFDHVNERVVFPDTLTPCLLSGDILHYRCRSVAEYRSKLDTQARIHGRVLASRGESAGRLKAWLCALRAFFKCYLTDGGILEGLPGREISRQHYLATLRAYRYARSITSTADDTQEDTPVLV